MDRSANMDRFLQQLVQIKFGLMPDQQKFLYLINRRGVMMDIPKNQAHNQLAYQLVRELTKLYYSGQTPSCSFTLS